MCSETFLRLSEEKRNRVLDAAWEEVTRVSFAEVSINRIVQKAEIARGSFYQYFQDKEEMMAYLMTQGWAYLLRGYQHNLRMAGGDIFRLQEICFEQFCAQRENADPVLERFMKFLKINPGLDCQKILGDHGKHKLVEMLWEDMDRSSLIRQDREFVTQVLGLSLVSVAGAVADCAARPETQETVRKELMLRLEIIRRGSMRNGGTV